jgi:sigma-E factor negative regulatory protein RseB
VIVGSALPLLILVGLVGIPSARYLSGSEQPISARSTPSSGSAEGKATPAEAKAEALALTWLRRSIRSGQQLGFSGTEVVTSTYTGGSTTRVLDLSQRPGGPRIMTEHNGSQTKRGAAPGSVLGATSATSDALAGLSERALAALAADYQLSLGGRDEVAGRAATVIVASSNGREVARMWLDNSTGLLLRQDVLDRSGRLHRMAAFLDLRTSADSSGPVVKRVNLTGVNRPVATAAWSNATRAEVARWRADGWPCPDRLAEGFVLLTAQRETAPSGAPVVHLTYGDGLSAISVFLQRGQLDGDRLTGLRSQKWGQGVVHVRAGWPEVLVWQGGQTVFTAVGDAEPTDLRAALSALPRQPKRGRLGSIQHEMGSAFAWFK